MHTIWTPDLRQQADESESFSDMLQVALRVIHRIPGMVHVVFGPMSTGGAGGWEANIARHQKVVAHFTKHGIGVFDQTPFGNSTRRLTEQRTFEGYPWFILEEFYGPLLETGHIGTVLFLPDWHTSDGAVWEHSKVHELGIPVEYLETAFVETL